ncbi:hypothetical protein ACWGI9_42470 [Streptomyces sp. NPDC054833]|jgi:sugar phosphate isomerase/epimerase
MTASSSGVPGEDPSRRTEFHGPTAIQGGPHSVQNNHFYAPVRDIRTLPWSKIFSAVKQKGPAVVVVIGLVSGGVWWLHDHLEQQARLNATRSACQQAQQAWSDHATASGSNKKASIQFDRRYARQLSEAARTARDPKIAMELQNSADSENAFADAYEQGTSEDMLAALSTKTHDWKAWWTDCTVALQTN